MVSLQGLAPSSHRSKVTKFVCLVAVVAVIGIEKAVAWDFGGSGAGPGLLQSARD